MKKIILAMSLILTSSTTFAGAETVCDSAVNSLAVQLGRQVGTSVIFNRIVSESDKGGLQFELFMVNNRSFSRRSRVLVTTRINPKGLCVIQRAELL